MTPKRPSWKKCSMQGVIKKLPISKLLTPGSPVSAGMRVLAEYGENIVCLRITKALKNNDFEAEIEFFEPVNVAPPKDLVE